MEFNNIRLDKEASQPLYRQLAEQIKGALQRGELHEGEKLPPIRAWKERLGVSPVTATQAYELLSQEGFAAGQVGRGTYLRVPQPQKLATSDPILIREQPVPYGAVARTEPGRLAELPTYFKASRSAEVQRLLQTALVRHRANPAAPADLIVMTSGSPAPELFNLSRWRAAMTKAGEGIERDNPLQLQYGSALGDEPTREWLADYMSRFGVRCDRDEILLTTGSQQGLDLLSRVLLGPGDTVLVESPCYMSALEIFESRGINWLPVPLDEEGLQVDVLERLAERHRPRLLYTVPIAQSPAGVTLADERRRRLLELARRFNFVIVEDDTCNEFYYGSEPPPSALQSYDDEGRVIYLKSFSKLIFPAVRFGAMVAKGVLLQRLAEAKAVFDRHSSLPLARTVLKFAGSAAFEREMSQSRTLYRERRDALLDGLARELGGSGVQWSRCEGGFSLLLSLPPGLRADEFHLEAAEQGVIVLPGPVFYPVQSDAPGNTLRLSFGDNATASLQEAVRRLSKALATLQARRTPLTSAASFITAV